MLWRATDLLSVIGESHSSARTFTYNSLFRFRGRYAAECESGGSDKEMWRRTAIDRRASEESAARIPLQCTGAAAVTLPRPLTQRGTAVSRQPGGQQQQQASRRQPIKSVGSHLSQSQRLQLDGELLAPPRLRARPLLSGWGVWITEAKAHPVAHSAIF